MYKVFVNDAAIIVASYKPENPDFKVRNLCTVNLSKLAYRLSKKPKRKYWLYSKNPEKLLTRLHKKLKLVEAGGGRVFNEKGEILFIYRNNKWDLPKGKIEKEEDMETCAVREVEEETAVENVKIVKFLRKTYHIFKRNGEFRLKLTYWYDMKTDYDKELRPQLDEGITRVKWVKPEKVSKKLENSYSNIKLLFERD